MAKHLIIITCLLLAFVLSSCQNKNKITGHWQEIPDHVGWINDFEDVLSAEEEKNLSQVGRWWKPNKYFFRKLLS